MNFLLSFIFLFSINVLADDFHKKCKVQFSKSELKEVERDFGQIALNRIADYIHEMKFLSKLEKPRKMVYLNNYLNDMLSEYDGITQNMSDHWATPKEFLKIGSGDCEDYAIIKYYSLQTLGYRADQLYFGVVKELYSGENHMVLLYYPYRSSEPFVLDNLSFRILKFHERVDLKFKYIFNNSGAFLVDKHGTKRKKINVNLSSFTHLLSRVESGE